VQRLAGRTQDEGSSPTGSGAVGTRGDPSHRLHDARNLPTVVLIAFLVVSALVSGITRDVMHDQEARLLQDRAADVAGVLTSELLQARSALSAISGAVGGSTDPSTTFRAAATPLVAPGPYVSAARVRVEAAGAVVIDAIGDGYGPGVALPGAVEGAVLSARRRSQVMMTTRVLDGPGGRRLGAALQGGGLQPDEVIYLERRVDGPAPAAAAAVRFDDVDVAFYVGTEPTRDALISASTDRLPIRGRSISRIVQPEADRFLLVVRARRSLVGPLGSALPFMVLLSGAATGTMAAWLCRVLQRRRRYALTLVDLRTRELADSMDVLRSRAKLDRLLQRASRDVAGAKELQGAIELLYAASMEIIPVDRVTLSVRDERSLRVVASAGPASASLPVGTTIELAPGHSLPPRRAAVIDPTTSPGYHYGMRSAMFIGLAEPGSESRAMLGFGCRRAGAYQEEDLPVIEALGRDLSGVLNQLLLIEREREAARRSHELDQLKSEFVGIVAHDLRSPMTVIAGFADILRSGGDQLAPHERDDYLARISSNVKQLAELVEDVLQVARIESGELTCEGEPFDLAKLVRDTASELTGTQRARPLNLAIANDLPAAFGDARRQWQVLSNLVGNALKFSPEDTPIDIRVTRKEDLIEVEVEDHGRGMRPEDAHRVFEKFVRSSHDGAPVAGTGLGLYIARSLVEAQGGTISVESYEGRGSTFRYTVPTAEEAW